MARRRRRMRRRRMPRRARRSNLGRLYPYLAPTVGQPRPIVAIDTCWYRRCVGATYTKSGVAALNFTTNDIRRNLTSQNIEGWYVLRYVKVWLISPTSCELQVTLLDGFLNDKVQPNQAVKWSDTGTTNRPPAITIRVPSQQRAILPLASLTTPIFVVQNFPTVDCIFTVRVGIQFKLGTGA